MQGHASAYAALGLSPGADRDEVDRAYRRLIKLHHPDRNGGDSGRAAEINRAYAELRGGGGAPPPAIEMPEGRLHARRSRRSRRHARERRSRSVLGSVLTLGISGLLLLQAEPLSDDIADGWGAFERAFEPVFSGSGQRRTAPSAIDDPLSEAAIAASVGDAVALSAAGDEAALLEHSRACHRDLRAGPSVVALDRCIAFDVAVAALADRDPVRDGGRFGASELTARQMSSGSLLSSDYLAIERRLDRVRNAVELSLRPPSPVVDSGPRAQSGGEPELEPVPPLL